MNASVNCGLLMFFVFLLINAFIRPIENKEVVPFLLGITVGGTYLSSFVYDATFDGHSFLLFFCCCIGGTVGCLSSVVMNPFMTQYKNDYITAARFGGSGTILLCALVAAVQSPGHDALFSPRVFIFIFAIFLSLSPVAYLYIQQGRLGLRTSEDKESEEATRETLSIIDRASVAKMVDQEGLTADVEMSSSFNNTSEGFDRPPLSPRGSISKIELHLINTFHDAADKVLTPRSELDTDQMWMRFALPHMCAVGWVSFNTWGMLSAFIPFAIKNSLPPGNDSNGSFELSLAIQLAGLCLVLGDVSTKFVKLSIPLCLIAFTVFSFTIYCAALGASGFETNVASPLMIFIFAAGRFFEAHIATSTYRTIATKVPEEYRADVARAVGIAEQLMTTFGTICSTIVVSQTSDC
jgi:hypothetical protein